MMRASREATAPDSRPCVIMARNSPSFMPMRPVEPPKGLSARSTITFRTLTTGSNTRPSSVTGGATSSDAVSACRTPMALGMVSPKISRRTVTTAVATTTAIPSDSMSCTATAVPRAAAAVLVRLLARRMVGRKRRGFSTSRGYDASARDPGADHVLQTNALHGKENGLRGGKKRREGQSKDEEANVDSQAALRHLWRSLRTRALPLQGHWALVLRPFREEADGPAS